MPAVGGGARMHVTCWVREGDEGGGLVHGTAKQRRVPHPAARDLFAGADVPWRC
jgi:hypothetical protein